MNNLLKLLYFQLYLTIHFSQHLVLQILVCMDCASGETHTPITERQSGTVQTQPFPYGVVAEELSDWVSGRTRARAAIWRWQWLPIISGITRFIRDWILESCSCCHLCQVGLIMPYLLVSWERMPLAKFGGIQRSVESIERVNMMPSRLADSPSKRHYATAFVPRKVSKTSL